MLMVSFHLQGALALSVMLMVSFHLQGALALSGMPDAQSKPVLLCSLNDNTVRLYDLPS